MRAVWYERQGAAVEVLKTGELPDPQPGPGEVRVRLTYSGVNAGDTKKRRGWLGSAMPFPRRRPPKQHVRPGVQRIPRRDGDGTGVRPQRAAGRARRQPARPGRFAPLFETTARPVNVGRFIFLDPASKGFYLEWDSLLASWTATSPGQSISDTAAQEKSGR